MTNILKVLITDKSYFRDNSTCNKTFTCRELKVANNISTCSLHVEQNKEEREIA
ncbi:hypothetical protein HUE87_04325 [Candidatus Sulfurimonas marisnigri]|uniref:Uncharacterized protein n=1 Tax=Candidatus Sulfurimonas marisnigri TaxID=2740405 RepID=A0A7S7RQI7_9BACT|nr:hypothetical protein [Candidatus Sulfurimonas marisnigri]QOY55467.1 hypothetical protein HUE87_04325 [Candidatus Sulfurimonas marisnigri]